MKKFSLECEINGKKIKKEIDPSKTLLHFLRGDMKLTGTKEGCGEGECGACLALVNGNSVNSCLMPAVQVHGKSVVTIEGLKGNALAFRLQESFAREAAVQCGFCTPGFIIKSEELLRKNPGASAGEIRRELSGNLCRCTGYENIISAVVKAGKKRMAGRGEKRRKA